MRKKRCMGLIHYPYDYTSLLLCASMYKGREEFFRDLYNNVYRITLPIIHYSVGNIHYEKSYWEKT